MSDKAFHSLRLEQGRVRSQQECGASGDRGSGISDPSRDIDRILGILCAAEAHGRERLAVHLALHTQMTLAEAVACLRSNAADHPSPEVVAATAEREAQQVLQ